MKNSDKIACFFAVLLMLFTIFIVKNNDEDFVSESFTRDIAPPNSGLNWIIIETSGNRSYVLVNDIEHEAVKYRPEKIEQIIREFEIKKQVKVEKHTVEFFPNEEGFFFKGVFLEHKPLTTK